MIYPPVLAVFAVSGFDQHLAAENAEWMAEACPSPNNPVLICYTTDVQEMYRERINAAMKKAFARQYWYEPHLPREATGWPQGPNLYFANIADYCLQVCAHSWLFLEPDVVPVKRGWLEALETEHYRHGKLATGYVQRSWTPDRTPAGWHLVGAALYDKTFVNYTDDHRVLDIAFDIGLQNFFVGAGNSPETAINCWHTNLYHHAWLSARYREDPDGVIRCEVARARIPGQEKFALARDLHPGAVVCHGCKDFSIFEVLRARRNRELAAAKGAEVSTQVSSNIVSLHTSSDVITPPDVSIFQESDVSMNSETDSTLSALSPEEPLPSTATAHGVQGDPATGFVDSPHETGPGRGSLLSPEPTPEQPEKAQLQAAGAPKQTKWKERECDGDDPWND